MKKSRIAKLVCFGRAGETVHCGGGVTISGYGSPDNPHAAEPGDGLVIPDGTPAVDKQDAVETSEGFSWVFRSPMVDVDLPDGGYAPCPTPSAIFAEAVSGNSFGGLLAAQSASRLSDESRGPLDFVSVSEYVDGWRIAGARIGKYADGQIVWDD